MRKLAIAMALASTALATPAVARDNSWYVGIEGGLMIVEDTEFDASSTTGGTTFDQIVRIGHKKGVDIDVIGGYDFGAFRVEAEAGYKRASIDELNPDGVFIDADGSVRSYSVMGNLLLDIGPDEGWSGYAGIGLGLATVRYKIAYADAVAGIDSGSARDRSIAYQGIAGVRYAITDNVDVGLKYRYFVAPKLDYDIDFGNASTKLKTHSLLASLTYNFAPPVVILPPPPPPPPPVIVEPATQTCPDGSVILATDICPAPPVIETPPPPEPAPERG